MLTSIAGKSVVVTGASKGIGKGIARVFARNGAKVTISRGTTPSRKRLRRNSAAMRAPPWRRRDQPRRVGEDGERGAAEWRH